MPHAWPQVDPFVAYHLWVLVFPIVWATLAKQQQINLAKPIIALLSKEYHQRQAMARPNVVQVRQGCSGVRCQGRSRWRRRRARPGVRVAGRRQHLCACMSRSRTHAHAHAHARAHALPLCVACTRAQALLEGISLSQPQPKIPPELIKFLGKAFNAWHIAIPLLESHVIIFPDETRCFDALAELYKLVRFLLRALALARCFLFWLPCVAACMRVLLRCGC